MDLLSVVVPTLNRPAPLLRAVQSLLRQTVPDGLTLEIIVVDNSKNGNARPVIETLAGNNHCRILYFQEKCAGVASARNCGVNAASGRWVAFLDDDEEALEGWIAGLVATARATKADAFFGPIEAKSDGEKVIESFGRFFSRSLERQDRSDITDLAAYLGTNNSMFDRERCFDKGSPFDLSLNATGGEDSLLLKELVERGRTFAWAQNARVIEWVPDRRLSWSYVRKRKFLSGQIRVLVQYKLHPVRWSSIAGWMAVGLAQTALAGTAMILSWPISKERFDRFSAVCCGGLGKVLWMPRFQMALYGSGHVS